MLVFRRSSTASSSIRETGSSSISVARATGSTSSASEFRSQPLWGVTLHGPWLHDGRAETLSEAIEAHGGEAQAIRDAIAWAERQSVNIVIRTGPQAAVESAALLKAKNVPVILSNVLTMPQGVLKRPVSTSYFIVVDERMLWTLTLLR